MRLRRNNPFAKGKGIVQSLVPLLFFLPFMLAGDDAGAAASSSRLPIGIVVRTTENLTQGGWVWILNKCKELGVKRIDILVKQDEDEFASRRTGRTLQSGELLVALPGEKTAEGWENSEWLEGMIEMAKESDIEIWAWWPAFHDAEMARQFPADTFISNKKEFMVDPAAPEIQRRQEELIGKLLETYDFIGVSLDWIRYNTWTDGIRGPLARKFQQQEDRPLTQKILSDEYYKAQWFQMRASVLSNWISNLVQTWRRRDPLKKWGAFLLPWQFPEVSQDYRSLSRSGLDFLQPMAYWDNWGFPPEWVGETLMSRSSWLKSGTMYWPVLDLENSGEQVLKAFASLPTDHVRGVSWFVYGCWDEQHFEMLRQVMSASNPPGQTLKGAPWPRQVESAKAPRIGARIEPKRFSGNANLWTMSCLAELYKRSALSEPSLAPAIPVLAFHRFVEERKASNDDLWFTSSEFLEELFTFLRDGGFHVISLSQLQAHLISGDASMLPARPIVLTIDDGSKTILKVFNPLAEKFGYPFTVAMVTGWTADSEAARHKIVEYKKEDELLIWPEVLEMEKSGRAEFVSHSQDLHHWAAEQDGGVEAGPAATTRKYLPALKRQETQEEYNQRLFQGLLRSRQTLKDKLGSASTILTWPYGAYNEAGHDLAAMAGFSHFMLFKNAAFASYRMDAENISRISVTQADECVPLRFPDDAEEAQRWWLAFLKTARASASPALISAVLGQLSDGASRHPEAELSRAALEFLSGESARGMERIKALRAMCPHDAEVHDAIDAFLAQI